MTHVLQNQQGHNLVLDAYNPSETHDDYGDSYLYSFDDLGKPLYHFNIEQQATIMQDYYSGLFPDSILPRVLVTIDGFQTVAPLGTGQEQDEIDELPPDDFWGRAPKGTASPDPDPVEPLPPDDFWGPRVPKNN